MKRYSGQRPRSKRRTNEPAVTKTVDVADPTRVSGGPNSPEKQKKIGKVTMLAGCSASSERPRLTLPPPSRRVHARHSAAGLYRTRRKSLYRSGCKHRKSPSTSQGSEAQERSRQSLPSLVGTGIALAVAVTVPARGSCITTIPPKRARQECDGGHAWAGPARPLRASFFSASAPASKLLALAGPRRCSKPCARSFQFTCTSHSHGTS